MLGKDELGVYHDSADSEDLVGDFGLEVRVGRDLRLGYTVLGRLAMNENVESVIIEHLRHIRGRVDRIAEDMSDIKHRMSSLESAMVLVKREVGAGDETDASRQAARWRRPSAHARCERLVAEAGLS